jgi:imidazolonepropionase
MFILRNIKGLVQVEAAPFRQQVGGAAMQQMPMLEHAYLVVKDDKIMDFGPMSQCPDIPGAHIEDASDRYVLPCWCDSHTHIVFAASRESEFVDRIHGLTYSEIAQRGGGILNSAQRLREMPEELLFDQALERMHDMQQLGTGAMEIKSGYGLSLDAELKMLRVIRRLREHTRMPVKATFLGAHALPKEYLHDREGYLKLIEKKMLPRIADEGLADYIDVFCEQHFFSPEETARLIDAGARYGLKAKIHTNQFNSLGGIGVSVSRGALSVDHLEVLNDTELEELRSGNTLPVLLPSAPFFLNDHYPPARRLIDAGLPVVLATDYNPGSSPSGNMQFVLSLACIKLRMTPSEAIHAATLNGAAAMEITETHGSIAVGKSASFIVTKRIPSMTYIPYAFGNNVVERVWIAGERV